jgi:hypothetical protein
VLIGAAVAAAAVSNWPMAGAVSAIWANNPPGSKTAKAPPKRLIKLKKFMVAKFTKSCFGCQRRPLRKTCSILSAFPFSFSAACPPKRNSLP